MTFSYIRLGGLNQKISTDTIRFYFDNKKICKNGEVYCVNRRNTQECDVFFNSYEDFKDKSFCINNTNVTIDAKGSVYKDKFFVQNIHSLTTKDGLKCFFQAHIGKDVLIKLFNKSNGNAIIQFGHTPDFAAMDITCKTESLDNNYLKIKPLKSSKTIIVSGCNHNTKNDLFYYFDNTKQTGGVDVDEVTKINDETYLVLFMSSKCVIDVCTRKHCLQSRHLKVQEFYQCMVKDNDFGMFLSGDGLSMNEPENREHGRNTSWTKKRKRNNSESLLMNNLDSDLLSDCVQREQKKMKKDINNTSNSSEVVVQDGVNQESFNTQVQSNPLSIIGADSNRNDKCLQHYNGTNLNYDITNQSRQCMSSDCQKDETKQLDETIDVLKESFRFQHDDKGAQGPICMSKTEAKTKENSHTNLTAKITKQSPSKETKQLDYSIDVSKTTHNLQLDEKGARAPKCMRKRKKKKTKANRQVQLKVKRNFLPYLQLCQTLVSISVKQYFSRKLPEPSLEFHLNAHCDFLKCKVMNCTDDQLNLLFPVFPDRADSSKFDFPLLYKLIRYTITPLSPPTRGWGSRPLPGDITEEDDIERIKHFLTNNTTLNPTDFKNMWSDFSQAIIRLSCGKLSAEIMNMSEIILNQHIHQEKLENLLQNIRTMTDEVMILHQETFQEEELQDIPKKTDRNDRSFNAKEEISSSHIHTYQLPFLKEHKEYKVPGGTKTREIRDCTAIPGVGWIISDCNNSELIKIDRKHCISIYDELPKPMFVTCFDGDVAVSVFNNRKITVFDKNTWSIKKEIRTEESVLGITNMRKRLLVRVGNTGFRFIAPNYSDPLIRIEGDNMPYIAVWKDMIFLTNWKTDEIYCYNTTGEKQWIFRNSKLKSPNGVSTDKEGNIFVVGSYSHNICILSNNYKETKGYRFEDAGMQYPIAIDYDKSSCKFIVCNTKGLVKLFDVVA